MLLYAISATLLLLSLGACKEFPELESLYDASDPALPWPPTGSDFSASDVAEWPGQGQRFGKLWPRSKVPVLLKPIDFKEFEKKFLSRQQPVVVQGLLKEMQNGSGLNLKSEHLINSGRSALSFIEVTTASKKGSQQRISLREFLQRQRSGEEIFTRDHLSQPLKTELRLPSLLACRGLAKELLHETRHMILRHTFPLPVRQELRHQLYCQIEGEKEILLVDEKDFPSWKDMKTKDDPAGYGKLAPFVNVYNVDYKQTPELKDIRQFHIAKLTEGQCLFVPAGWIHQQNVRGSDHSVELRWLQPTNAADGESSYEDCETEKPLSPELTLGDVDWPGEVVASHTETLRRQQQFPGRKALQAQAHILEKYVLKEDSRSVKAFVAALKKDSVLLVGLLEWNDEYLEVAQELFGILDRNKDEVLDGRDLDGLKEEELKFWVGRTEDRLQDFAEIIFDMKIDAAGGGGSVNSVESMRVVAEEMIKNAEEKEKYGKIEL